MGSLVLDLQQELLKPDSDVLSALRKAQVIASKLHLSDFGIWVKQELNGYKPENDVPEYRKIKGILKARNSYRGWVSVQIPDEKIENSICTRVVIQSISELNQLIQSGSTDSPLLMSFSGEYQATLNRLCKGYADTEFSILIGRNNLTAIIDAVKNCLLEWTLKLEDQGILGENMKFTSEETQSAKGIPQQINNYYGYVVNGNVSGSQFAGDNSAITVTNNNGIDANEFEKLVKAITDNFFSLDDENKETILGAIEILREEIAKTQPKKSILSSGIKLLAPMVTIANGIPILAENIQKVIDFVCQLPPMLP